MDEKLLVFFGGVFIGVAIGWLLSQKKKTTPDGDEKLRQEIYDTLLRIKKDVESTI